MKIQKTTTAILFLFLVLSVSAQRFGSSMPPINNITIMLKFTYHAQMAECGTSAWGSKIQIEGIDVFQKVGEEKFVELATSCDYYPFEEGRLYYVTVEERIDPQGKKKNYIKKAEPVFSYLKSLDRKPQIKKFQSPKEEISK